MTPTAEDAVAALAARLYRAVCESWDHQQCNTEARAFIAALREHGWIWEPAAISFDNRRRGPRAHPDVIAQSMATIRAAIQDGQAKSATEQQQDDAHREPGPENCADQSLTTKEQRP